MYGGGGGTKKAMVAVCGGGGVQPPEHAPRSSGEEDHGGGGALWLPGLLTLVPTQGDEGTRQGRGTDGGPKRHHHHHWQTPAGGRWCGDDSKEVGGPASLGGDGQGQGGCVLRWVREGDEEVCPGARGGDMSHGCEVRWRYTPLV